MTTASLRESLRRASTTPPILAAQVAGSRRSIRGPWSEGLRADYAWSSVFAVSAIPERSRTGRRGVAPTSMRRAASRASSLYLREHCVEHVRYPEQRRPPCGLQVNDCKLHTVFATRLSVASRSGHPRRSPRGQYTRMAQRFLALLRPHARKGVLSTCATSRRRASRSSRSVMPFMRESSNWKRRC